MSNSEEPQMQLDTRAIELAGQALGTVQSLAEELRTGLTAHEKHDSERFAEVTKSLQHGFSGVYSRLWIAAGAVIAAMGAVILVLVDKVL